MTPHPAAQDPVLASLADLVDAGHLSTDQARAAYAAGRAVPRPDRRWDAVAVAVGSALVAALVLLAAERARAEPPFLEQLSRRPELDWSVYSLGLLGSFGLLAFAAAARLLVRDPERRALLMSWPVAMGAIGAGLMLDVALGDFRAATALSAFATVVIAGVGYWVVRRPAPLVATLAGLAVGYVAMIAEIGRGLDLGSGQIVFVSGMFALLVFAVTLGGWALPSRDLAAIVIGVVGIAGQTMVLSILPLFGTFTGSSAVSDDDFEDWEASGPIDESSFDGSPPAWDATPFEEAAWAMLGFMALQCLLWAFCHRRTGHAGYLVLVLAGVVTAISVATTVLFVEHPTYWEAALGLAGAAFLAYAGLRALGQRPRAA